MLANKGLCSGLRGVPLCAQAAKDYRVDADLHAACEADAKKLCADVNPGEGRVQDCLRDKTLRVSGECQEELFRQEVENADDLRLSHRLFRKCNGDKNRFCPDVKYGACRIQTCLSSDRHKTEKFTIEKDGGRLTRKSQGRCRLAASRKSSVFWACLSFGRSLLPPSRLSSGLAEPWAASSPLC